MNTTPTTPIEAITTALAAHPESSAAELAEAAGIGGSTTSKHLATLERDGIAVRHPGGHEGGRRVADRWELASTEGAPTADSASTSRLHKGELSTLVLDYLKAHGNGAIGPSAIGKALSRSSGAVANACQRLESSGSLRLVSNSPRRYQIAGA
ncbi:MAG: winged helix-turn-helix transcriptional regulator [Acidimicrobiales bacterium]|jgi:DNA-binding IclR family transcriptional regulator